MEKKKKEPPNRTKAPKRSPQKAKGGNSCATRAEKEDDESLRSVRFFEMGQIGTSCEWHPEEMVSQPAQGSCKPPCLAFRE
ncbi:hypothetical protein TNIN_29901 [Trichonephila inaurata madagascariensis]|uniref:Uncharacterized protein n=1 Tax=Trichonephila inaurata madagascariensis TaxID=2747483 RepID=A0A8X6YFV4_9ARAC|nr:hypothetical protein TNIN_29901 [Trichonephila inaurata madagascariensis]